MIILPQPRPPQLNWFVRKKLTVWAVHNDTAGVAVTAYDRRIFFGPNLVPSIAREFEFFLWGKLKILNLFRIFFRFSTDEITFPVRTFACSLACVLSACLWTLVPDDWSAAASFSLYSSDRTPPTAGRSLSSTAGLRVNPYNDLMWRHPYWISIDSRR